MASLLSKKMHTEYKRQGVNTWFMWEQSQGPRSVFPRRPRHPFAPSSAWFELPPQPLGSSFENLSYYEHILVIKYFCHVLKVINLSLLYMFHSIRVDLLGALLICRERNWSSLKVESGAIMKEKERFRSSPTIPPLV